jgi:hypothetical protein
MANPLFRAADRRSAPAAMLKSEAMLRILKGRTTAEQEAVRLQVDVATVRAWLESTFRAITRGPDETLMRSLDSGGPEREGAPLAPARSRGPEPY